MPQAFAGERINAGEAAGVIHHQFRPVFGGHQNGRAEATDPFGIFVAAETIGASLNADSGVVELPHGFAGALVEGDKVGLGIGATVNVNQIAMNNRRGGGTPRELNLAQIPLP